MSLISCTILITRQASHSIAFSRSLSNELQLGTGRTCNLRVGSKRITVPFKTLNRKGDYLIIPSSVASAIHLPRTGKCYIKSNGDQEVQIGPLIGIMTNISNNPDLPFGGRTPFIREIMDVGRDECFFFSFSPRNVNWANETVTGYFYQSGSWSRKTVPLPDVIYNRLSNRGDEKTLSIKEIKNRFVKRNIPLFNWSFFDKWEVYRLLDGDKEMSRHVPDSQINPSLADIRMMLAQYRFLYLKPTPGSLGFGIFRLTRNPNKGYFLRYRNKGSNVLMRFPSFDAMMNVLKKHKLRMSEYVVQQGIQLIELDGCPIDFRFHLVKNGSNEWTVVGIGAKKAGKGSVTTHVRTGGQLLTPEKALEEVFGSEADTILSKMKAVSIKLAQAIEKAFPHSLGELGLDLGIDQDSNVWMFEANSKPGRTIFKHPALKTQGMKTSSTIFEHCLYLSRFFGRRE